MILLINFSVRWVMALSLTGIAATAHAASGLFPATTTLTAPAAATKLPEFAFANLHGGTLKSSEMKGRVIVIRFWATW